MILRRLGNKSKMAKNILQHAPPHKFYIEPFFGAGGMFFNKPKVKYNMLNDLDSNVFNLFQVVINKKDELLKIFDITPIHIDLLKYWNKNEEVDPVKKALRFIYISNFGYMGGKHSLRFGFVNDKNTVYDKIDKTVELLKDVQFHNCCFRKFLKSASLSEVEKENTYIYADPPYLNTGDNYSNSFTEKDSNDLFNALEGTGCKFAMSEFNHSFILDQAKQRNLNIITIGERQNLKSRRTEILVTNYKNRQPELF